MNGTWVKSDKASKFFGVHPQTLRRWADTNLVEFKKTAGGHRVYRIDIDRTKDSVDRKPVQASYIYIRVSSQKQKDDLERQKEFMLSQYPGFTVIQDIGSGLNFKRKGLLKMLELSSRGLVEKIVVASKDRLCRFGFDLIQWQLSQNNTELLVHEQIDKTPEEEFTEDVLAVLQVFACRWNGKRKYCIKNKKDKVTVDITPEEKTTGA